MQSLRAKLVDLIPRKRDEIESLLQAHGDQKLSDVTVAQVYGGMRGVKCMVTETSALDPQEGIRFRGFTVPDVLRLLPRAEDGEQPLPEGLFWLLLTGEIPSTGDVAELTACWRSREALPDGVTRTLDALPEGTHPMTQLSVGVMALQSESVFVRRYREGMHKTDYWDATFEDAMTLLARLPLVAAHIYRRTNHGGRQLPAAPPGLDWAANLALMLRGDAAGAGLGDLMRLYLTLHADHEGGNVSAHATHLVGSALSDPYLAVSAGLNGLAGPLHGLANQEVMRWLQGLREALGDKVTDREQLSGYVWDTLRRGQVIPGYGHGVLRATDPRYLAEREFALRHLPNDENFKIVSMLFDVVPEVLKAQGKAANPWPNVDAHSGVLLTHYGVVEHEFYTVLFGVSRAMGVLASLIWDRALGMPLERPKSVTTDWIVKQFAAAPIG